MLTAPRNATWREQNLKQRDVLAGKPDLSRKRGASTVKLRILKLLADARMKKGRQINLRAFHDFVWKNGNVPIALQQWEYLGDGKDVP